MVTTTTITNISVSPLVLKMQIGNVPINAMQTTVTSATPVTAPLAFTAMSLPVTIGHA
ncbi:hypothetical protein PCASD_01819 [Puccinia coronata f. sp. avenae]|uniref:Uncharacterized protein n=1 Tax=Puccinia coronata f. sp. avenae TaxID=200324 RepID=A0A2N5VJB0_9BASI|nr:hypothetical protein PCASD_01819 [Puccinia coronata f. sp. avenae]